jgi:segregation and condensation protein B
MEYSLAHHIQAILFSTSEEWDIAALAKVCSVEKEAVEQALEELTQLLECQSIMLIRVGNSVSLVTRPAFTGTIATIRRDELQKELSKASAETLAVIIYSNGASKAHIEMIRGVNASYALRNLQMRGLIETVGSGRATLYRPTTELLQSFGVASVEALPSYQETYQLIQSLLSHD